GDRGVRRAGDRRRARVGAARAGGAASVVARQGLGLDRQRAGGQAGAGVGVVGAAADREGGVRRGAGGPGPARRSSVDGEGAEGALVSTLTVVEIATVLPTLSVPVRVYR